MWTSKLDRYWIFGPAEDTAFILLTPLAIAGTFAAARRGGWMDGLVAFALVLAMAHYLPGVLRAYGDRALFRRFRLRLILAPLFLFSTVTGFAYLNLNFVFLLTGLWGAWHWMMQVYGFARIYDAKVQSTARTTARLDHLMCFLWFGMCIFVVNNVWPAYITRLYESGGPVLPAGLFAWFARAWLAVTVAVTVVYVVHSAASIRQGRSPNPLKFILIAVTFGYLSATASMLDRTIVGYAMFESWHDVQYLAIVWAFNLNRARKNPESGPFIHFLFRPRVILVMAYVALCLAFGSLTHAWRLFANETLIRVVAAIVPSTALLHYYLDGFIWKIRETETRQALGVRTETVAGTPRSQTLWLRHAALWTLFVVPAALLFAMETRGNSARPPLEVYESLVETFPDHASAQYELGRELQEMGRLREAKAHLERALALKPDYYDALARLGALLVDQGSFRQARLYFERALEIDAKDSGVHNNFGIVLDELGDLEGAKAHLETALELNPAYALAHNNLGMVLAKMGNVADAKQHFEQALRIQPDYDHARQNLARLK